MNKTNLKYFINIIYSILFVISFNLYLFENNLLGNRSIFNIIILLFCIKLFKKNENISIKEKKHPLLFSIILSLSLVIGKTIYNTNDILNLFSNLKPLLMFLGFIKFFEECFYILFQKLTIKEKTLWKIYKNKHFFVILWIFIFLSWLPAFFAYFPGILSYDSIIQTNQALGINEYTTIHPPIHTFIWQIFINIGKLLHIEGLIPYTIIQMLFLSFVFTKLIYFLIKHNANNWIILSSIIFLSINPSIAIFSLEMTKDVYFSGFFILFILQTIKLLENTDIFLNKTKNWTIFIIITLFTCLFRNNAFYVYLFFSIILYKKEKNIKIFTLLTIPIVLYLFINNILYPCLKIKKDNISEFFSLPIQQIGYVINKYDNSLDEEIINKINKFVKYEKIAKNFNPRFADPIKEMFYNNSYFSNNINDFISLWFELSKKYPAEYISEFLTLNIPYWYIDANTIDEYSKRIYIETDNYPTNYNITRPNTFPKLYNFYSKISSFELFKNKPIISNLFSITTPFWIIMTTLFTLLFKKNYKRIIILIPLILLMLTYFVGPVSNFRYIFPIFVLYPLLLYLMFENVTKKKF